MKASNNLNQDLKEEIEESNNKCSRLQVFYDDHEEIINGVELKAQKKMNELVAKKDDEVKQMQEDRDRMQKELKELQSEFHMKMTEVKLM